MTDNLGPRMDAESRLATLAWADDAVATRMGYLGLPFAFDAETVWTPLRSSLQEAWPKPKTTVIAHD